MPHPHPLARASNDKPSHFSFQFELPGEARNACLTGSKFRSGPFRYVAADCGSLGFPGCSGDGLVSRKSSPKDPRGGHVRIYWDILDSPAWRVLSHADVRVYLGMRRKLGRTNNGDINATLAEMKHASIGSSSTLSAALRRLELLGFIEKTRQGGIAMGGKLCNLYRFTDEPTFDIAKAGVRESPATKPWVRFKTQAEARAAIRPIKAKNTSKVRPSNQTASSSESEDVDTDSTIEHVTTRPLRLSKLEKPIQIDAQPA